MELYTNAYTVYPFHPLCESEAPGPNKAASEKTDSIFALGPVLGFDDMNVGKSKCNGILVEIFVITSTFDCLPVFSIPRVPSSVHW